MGKEHGSMTELEPEVVQAFAAAFLSRFDLYPVQRVDTGRYIAVKEQLHLPLVGTHLKGDVTLGAYALDEHSQAKWICFDADNREQWLRLWQLAHRLQGQGVRAYPEASRRGGHLWLFLETVPGDEARRFGLQLQAEYELLDVELFPKQDKLTSGPGSLVRLPLGVHRKDGRRYYFLSLNGQPLAPTIREQIKYLSAPQLVPPVFVAALLSRAFAPQAGLPEPALVPTEDEQVPLPDQDLPLSERLKARISVYEFVSRYVQLDEWGKGLCPFHDDHEASFSVHRSENYWNCFSGCGGGDLIHFWRKWREVHGQSPDFVATIKDLADMLLPR